VAIVIAGLAVVFYAHYHIGAYRVRRIKLVCYTRLSSRLAARATLSLRLGHTRVLPLPRSGIHSAHAASLPPGKGLQCTYFIRCFSTAVWGQNVHCIQPHPVLLRNATCLAAAEVWLGYIPGGIAPSGELLFCMHSQK